MKTKKNSPLPEVKYAPVSFNTVSTEGVFEGYASLFNTIDIGDDIVRRGAFAKSLQKTPPSQIKLLYQHNPNEPIGIWQSVREDHKGLYVKGRLLTEITRAKEVHVLMKRGALDGLSIGFKTKKSSPLRGGKGRQLLELDLYEISIVTFPMHPSARVTNVKAKPGANGLATIRDFERWLTRDAGFTRQQAKIAIADGFKTLLKKRDALQEQPQTKDIAKKWRQLTQIVTKSSSVDL